MKPVKLTIENFQTEALEADQPVLIDFWAPWCGPCKMLSPIVEEVAATREDIKVCKVNIDEELELAQNFSVMSIPTLVVIKNGKVTNTAVGLRPLDAVVSLVEN